MVVLRSAGLVGLMLLLGALPAQGQSGAAAVGQLDPTLATPEPSATGLPAISAQDTVRTNLWLAEALMGEIVAEAAAALGPAPAAVRIVPLAMHEHNDIFMPVAARILGGAGYELYLAVADTAGQVPVDYEFGFNIQTVSLQYPDVGRTLGIWRRWIDREMEVSIVVEISEAASGRLLLSDRIERRFGDRLADSDFNDVESATYDFTTAEPGESGWQRRAEEMVVLGTLAGLVAIYFANTGN